jgi:hypothetical protein
MFQMILQPINHAVIYRCCDYVHFVTPEYFTPDAKYNEIFCPYCGKISLVRSGVDQQWYYVGEKVFKDGPTAT